MAGGGTNNFECYLHARPYDRLDRITQISVQQTETPVWPGTIRMSLNVASEHEHDTFSTKKHLCGRKKFSLS